MTPSFFKQSDGRSPVVVKARAVRAFTLIELLVSITIMSTLMAVLVPALSSAKREAMRIACQHNLHEMGKALWAYSVANDSRLPCVVSPMTNGGGTPGFGNGSSTNDQIDPFNRELWPISFQNLMMPLYLGSDSKIFVCPAAVRGWPREGPFAMTYRDAGINQPNGTTSIPDSYFRENFAFMDGRPMNELRVHFTGNPVADAQLIGRTRSTFMRDMVSRNGADVIGPHNGGINVLNRDFGVETRDHATTVNDLGIFGGGVEF